MNEFYATATNLDQNENDTYYIIFVIAILLVIAYSIHLFYQA